MIILHCESYENYLIEHLFPNTLRADVRYEDIPDLLDDNTTILAHLDCTYVREYFKSSFPKLDLSRIHFPPSLTREALQSALAEIGAPNINDLRDEAPSFILKSKTNSFGRPDIQMKSRVGEEAYPFSINEFPYDEYPILCRNELKAVQDLRNYYTEPFIENPMRIGTRVFQLRQRYLICMYIMKNSVFREHRSAPSLHIVVEANELDLTNRFNGNPLEFLYVTGQQVRDVATKFDILFAAYDFVYSNDLTPYLIDLNFTPWWGHRRKTDAQWIRELLIPNS